MCKMLRSAMSAWPCYETTLARQGILSSKNIHLKQSARIALATHESQHAYCSPQHGSSHVCKNTFTKAHANLPLHPLLAKAKPFSVWSARMQKSASKCVCRIATQLLALRNPLQQLSSWERMYGRCATNRMCSCRISPPRSAWLTEIHPSGS